MMNQDIVSLLVFKIGFLVSSFFHALISILKNISSTQKDLSQTLTATLAGTDADANTANLFIITLCLITIMVAGGWYSRAKLLSRPSGQVSLLRMALRSFGQDLFHVFIMIGMLGLVSAIAFGRQTPADQLFHGLIWLVIRWHIFMAGVRVFLQPGLPILRVAPVGDTVAVQLYRLYGLIAGLELSFVTLMPILLNNGQPLESAQPLALVLSLIIFVLSMLGLRILVRNASEHRTTLLLVGLTILPLYWIIWVGAVMMRDFTLYDAFLDTLSILAAIAVMRAILRFADGDSAGEGMMASIVYAGLRRILTALSCVFGCVMVSRSWLVDVFGLITPDHWPLFSHAAGTGLGIALAGYVSFAAIRTWTLIKFGKIGEVQLPGYEEGSDESHTGSRLGTILPILSLMLLIAALVFALLFGLAEYNINISPLLAGAGIFGIAISFGSQSLVRDIVSGMFYLADDAFRIGEYIDTGRHKGTVEKISLRSMRVRHQNGQLHNIPYGQLGSVTNFGRDYTTLKFNLRLDRDTDIEVVRKIAKKLGQSMLEGEEFGAEFIQPLKLQGLVDIQENALVTRFKFTVRPSKPTEVQRDVMRRLYQALTEGGVKFARASVIVKGAEDDAQRSGAAASRVVAPPAAPRMEPAATSD